MHKITPFLWFNDNAEEAMNFYLSIFDDSEILETHKLPENSPGEGAKMLTGTFRLQDQQFMVLNGGPQFTFTEAISLYVNCKDQAEVDKYWDALLADGGEASRCGWLKDKFGLSWQIVPTALGELMGDPDPEKAGRVMTAMLKMVKLNVQELQDAYDGK